MSEMFKSDHFRLIDVDELKVMRENEAIEGIDALVESEDIPVNYNLETADIALYAQICTESIAPIMEEFSDQETVRIGSEVQEDIDFTWISTSFENVMGFDSITKKPIALDCDVIVWQQGSCTYFSLIEARRVFDDVIFDLQAHYLLVDTSETDPILYLESYTPSMDEAFTTDDVHEGKICMYPKELDEVIVIQNLPKLFIKGSDRIIEHDRETITNIEEFVDYVHQLVGTYEATQDMQDDVDTYEAERIARLKASRCN